jgi:CRISPR-associated endonuclease/helicase Cas3
MAQTMLAAARELHSRHHSIDECTGTRVSFGLMRMANIEPLFEVALAMFRQPALEGARIHLCVYHSRHPLLIRSAIEAPSAKMV